MHTHVWILSPLLRTRRPNGASLFPLRFLVRFSSVFEPDVIVNAAALKGVTPVSFLSQPQPRGLNSSSSHCGGRGQHDG